MGKTFDIVYEDFSGGHYFGSQSTKQPKNTWTGEGMIHCAADGTLMPGAPLVAHSDDSIAGGWSDYVADGSTGLRYMRTTGGTSTFVVEGDGSSPYAVGTPLPEGAMVQFCGLTLMPLDAGRVLVYDPVAGTTTVHATGLLDLGSGTTITFDAMYVWDAWALGVFMNRIYFSAPLDATSWNSNDYIDVGDTGSTIRAIVSTVQGMLVATATGWWQISGVLGQTTVKRQVTTKGVVAGWAAAVDTDQGVMFNAGGNPPTAVVGLLSGTQTPTVLWDPSESGSSATLTKVGGHYVFAARTMLALDSMLYMWSERTRNWRKIALPAPNGLWEKGFVQVASDLNAEASIAYIITDGFNTFSGDSDRVIYTYTIDPFNPPYDAAGTAYTSATAELAGYDHPREFTIDEVICELDLGSTAYNKSRAVGVQMVTNAAVMDYSSSVSSLHDAASALQTFTLPAMASTAGERVVVRFSPNNGGATMTATPRITLQGLKLRRCIVRCREVD